MTDVILAEDIYKMTYPDFVAFLGQKNTPPGGMYSLKRWIELGLISSHSTVLDLACSNGFSSREAAKITGCSGKGIDISELAISVAKEEAVQEGLVHLLDYQVGDASSLPFNKQIFSHILGGCNFSFISSREKALSECKRTLIQNGKLCIANFYYEQIPPEHLLDQVQEVIGFRPEAYWNYSWWDKFFNREFSKSNEEIKNLPIIEENNLKKEIHMFIYEKSPYLREIPLEIKQACFEKLLGIRKILNEHRKYQNFSISIWN